MSLNSEEAFKRSAFFLQQFLEIFFLGVGKVGWSFLDSSPHIYVKRSIHIPIPILFSFKCLSLLIYIILVRPLTIES